MTLVIELTKAQEERLQADDLQFLKELRQNLLEKIELQKKHKVLKGFGMLAGGTFTVDDFLAEKHEATLKEEGALGW